MMAQYTHGGPNTAASYGYRSPPAGETDTTSASMNAGIVTNPWPEQLAAYRAQADQIGTVETRTTYAQSLEVLLNRLDALTGRLGMLADRVFGPAPPPDPTPSRPPGHPSQMSDTIDELHRTTERLWQQVERLEGIA